MQIRATFDGKSCAAVGENKYYMHVAPFYNLHLAKAAKAASYKNY